MTETDEHRTVITSKIISANENDAFRRAFSMIARAAIPFMASDCPYLSDLLHDAAFAAWLDLNETMHLLVRDHGTNLFQDPIDAFSHCTDLSDGQAVLRVTRRPFDNFNVEVVYTREDGFIHVTRDV